MQIFSEYLTADNVSLMNDSFIVVATVGLVMLSIFNEQYQNKRLAIALVHL